MDTEALVVQMDERTFRALYDAVNFTLENWTGQPPVQDQETLWMVKTKLQAGLLEFQMDRS